MMKNLAVALILLVGITFQAQAKNTMHIVINNHLGAPEMLIDENQHVLWQAEYDEFGKATILVEEVEFNHRFPGQYYDKETGLSYNYYRDYDPSTGRYVQSDPIGLAGGINTYGYVGGNPVMYTDPLGLFMCPPGQRGYYIDDTETSYKCEDGGSSNGFGTGDSSAFPASTNDACVQACIKKEILDCVTPTSTTITSKEALEAAACVSAVVISCSAQTCDKCDAEYKM